MMISRRAALVAALSLIALPALAADYPAPQGGRLDRQGLPLPHRRGDARAAPALHDRRRADRRAGADPARHRRLRRAAFLTPAFAGELFGEGQPLDATKYFIILPDAIGAGKSTKPSDGLRAKFPLYNYDDMVAAQHRLVTEGLGIKHLRLVIGNSMGGMQTWMWGAAYPDFMDALVPMASQPTAMSSRNWMMRRMITDAVRNDPDWKNGNYTTQPQRVPHRQCVLRHRHQRRHAGLPEDGADAREGRQAARTTRWPRRSRPTPTISSISGIPRATTTPSPGLEKIQAALLAINAADDERNPPETGLMTEALKRVKNGKLYLIPASEDTRGHGTTGMAKFYKQQLQELLQTAPKRTM